MKADLTKEEIETVIKALRFYRDEVTHNNNGVAGLSYRSKDYRIITRVLCRYQMNKEV